MSKTTRIGLDLAFRTVGIAIITEEKLFYTSHDLSKEKLPQPTVVYHMADKVWGTIQPYLSAPHVLVLEDIFKGKWDCLKNIARVQGAIIDRYIAQTGKEPIFTLAVDARKKVKVKAIAPKIEIQLWALDTFKLNENIKLDKVYRNKIEETLKRYYILRNAKGKRNRVALKALEKVLDEQTNKFAELTGMDNHMSDALVLALGAEV